MLAVALNPLTPTQLAAALEVDEMREVRDDGSAVLCAEIDEMPDIGLTCQYYDIWNLYLRSRSIYCCTCWVAYSRGGQEKMESHVFTHFTRLYWTGVWLLAMEVLCTFAPGQRLIRWPCLQEKFMLSGILHSVQISM